MDQREIEEKTQPIQIIYYIESQIIDNENADKIIWNSQLIGFDQLINQAQEVEVLGLYGVKSTVLEFLEKKSQCTMQFPQNFQFYSKRGVLCLVQHEKIYYLAFIGPDEYFQQDIFKESIEITLFRFLKDICSEILLLPSDQIMLNWKRTESHFYEDNRTNQVEKFKWSRDTQAKQEEKKIKINIDQTLIEELKFIKNSFENTFTSQGVKKVNQYRIDELILKDLFLQIFQEKQADKVDLTQFPFQIQNIFHDQLKKLEMVVELIYLHYFNKIYFKLTKGPFQLYFCDYHIIPNLFDIIFKFLWQRLEIYQINYDRNDDFQQLQKFITNLNFNKQKCINEDLIQIIQDIVDEYINELNDLYKQNNQESIQQYLDRFRKDITLEADKIDYAKDLLIEIKQYQLTPVQKDQENSQNIEIIGNKQDLDFLIIDNGLTFDYVFHQICYYCKTLNQKLDMYICQLVNLNQQKYQYLWVIDDNNSQYKILYSLKQSVEQELLFYYDQQNSKLYAFNSQIGLTIMKFSQKGKIFSGERNIQWRQQKTFKQLCYLQYFDCFILLGSDNILYKYKNNDLDYEVLKLNRNGSDGSKNYKKIMSTGTGYYFCLINQEFCDFYNFNNQLVYQIKFESIQFNSQDIFNDIYLLSDRSNWYLCLLNGNQQICMMLKEFNQDKITIPQQKNIQPKKQSNPFLDLLKGSIVKFGPAIKILPKSQQPIELYISSTLQNGDHLEKYFQIQNLISTYRLQKTDIYKIRGINVKINDFMHALISRGSMQLCTIRNSNLIPLEKGLIRNQGSKKVINIMDKINQLSFGIFEIFTTLQAKNIFIISIMGKQSLGKSYLLNRVFGTRFGVSSARCTDGIWISFGKIKDIMFVVLDCEGLLGARRTSEEEFKLLSFITSLSDYTILNQDLNFNRNLEHLLNNLPQLRGKILFQGQLMIIIRDVATDGREAAKNENNNFLERINSKGKGNFISNIFQDQFSVMIMNNFLEKVFEEQIIELKNDFICEAQKSTRWNSVQQVINSMKILLVQLEVNDHRTLEEIELEHLIDKIQKISTSLWFSKLDGDLETIDMHKEDISFQNLLGRYLPSGNISSLQHDQLLKQANHQIQEYFDKRIDVVNERLAIHYKQLKEEEKINQLKLQIINHLRNYAFKYQLCGQKCHQCFLICSLKLNHSAREYTEQLGITKKMEDQKNYQEKLLQDLIKKDLPFSITEEQFNKQKEILGQLQQQNDKLKEQIEYVEMMEEKQFHLDSINKILQIQTFDEQKFKKFPILLLQQCGLKQEQNLKFEDFLQKSKTICGQQLQQNIIDLQQLKEIRYQKNRLLQEYDEKSEILVKELSVLQLSYKNTSVQLQEHQNLQLQLIQELEKQFNLIDIKHIDTELIIQQVQQQEDINDEKIEILKNTLQLQIDLDIKIQMQNNQLTDLESEIIKVEQQQKEIKQKIYDSEQNEAKDDIKDSQILNDKIYRLSILKDQNEKMLNKITDSLYSYQKLQEHKQMFDIIDNKLNNFLFDNFPHHRLSDLKSQLKNIQNQIKNSNDYLLSHQQYQQSKLAYQQLEKQKQIQQLILNQSHNCCRGSHDCDQVCQSCQDKTKCKFESGHQESHLCVNKQHFCNKQCQVQNCQNKCQHEFDHQNSIKHDCLIKHQCNEKCTFCQGRCDKNLSNFHQIHLCDKINCDKKCYFSDHYFDERQKCQNSCHQQHNEEHERHICSKQQHQCWRQCEQKGICHIGYTEEWKIWKNSIGSFPYIVYKQNDIKKQCQFYINHMQIEHVGPHICNSLIHTCDKRCPECNAFCTKEYNHPGKHKPHSHRNKDQQQFTSITGNCKLKLQIKDENFLKLYNIGECAEAETCSRSCSRRSRAHFHLIECPGNEKCLSRQLNRNGKIVARHQNKLYEGAKSQQQYDEVLCESYWDYLGWEHPVIDIEQKESISQCNYYCSKCNKDEKLFCSLKAWHNNSNDYKDHKIICSDQHKFTGIDVAFVIDTTESMISYIHIVKTAIENFQYVSKRIPDPNAIQYSIVTYSDHKYNYHQNDQQVTKSINFTNYQNALNFLDNLPFEFSTDVCEAMMDGLDEANKLNWRQQSTKYLFIVADAPPHGLIFHNAYVNFKYDNYPQGCPCGLKERQVLENLNARNINIIALKLNEELNLTINIFKQFANVKEIRNINVDDYVQQMEKIVCLEQCNYEITLPKI